MQENTTSATVYLVGAGPGDPGLITVRARELLETADILVYDYLASEPVMAYANPGAERIFVGKKGFAKHLTQAEINNLLVKTAQEHPGKRIVRLKGGDPYVFGRGGEEALALKAAGIGFEVVPGVTAGIAAPAYAGIPVTHRTCSSSVTLVTGHEMAGKPESAIDWDALGKLNGTLCLYIGIHDLPHISEQLIFHGKPASTPVALVRWGTTPQQETLTGTLETIASLAEEANFQAPAMIVVGEVVSLRDKLDWFESCPLFGRTVVVTRSRAQASSTTSQLRALGAQVFEYPSIAIAPRVLDEGQLAIFHNLSRYDWIVLTSANGVECFMADIEKAGLDSRALAGVKIASIGPATARALKAHGLTPDLIPPRFIAESIASSLIEQGVGAGSRILLARAAAARNALHHLLENAGASVDVMPLYDTVMPSLGEATEELVDKLRAGAIDAVTFTSSSTARNFVASLDQSVGAEERDNLLENVKLASIGPVTSETLRAAGLEIAAEADPYTIPGLIACLTKLFA